MGGWEGEGEREIERTEESSLIVNSCQVFRSLESITLSYAITHQRTRELQQLECSCLCRLPTHLVIFLVTTSISLSLQAYMELHALSSLWESISLWYHHSHLFSSMFTCMDYVAVSHTGTLMSQQLGDTIKFVQCLTVVYNHWTGMVDWNSGMCSTG